MSHRNLISKSTLIVMSFVFTLSIFLPTYLESNASDDKINNKNDQELWKKIKPLGTIVSYMNTGAHPDDENSALLAYMSLGKGVQSSTVIAHRGAGGQNEIGSELGDGLSIIRTRELQEASKVTNNDVFILNEGFDDSVNGFGFSKTPEETLEEWGEEEAYKRIIKNIREQRPDILFTSMRDVEGQHGNHRAMSLLTQRAFDDAGDSEVFPEQLEEGLETWQPQKFYLPGTDANDEEDHTTLKFNVGGKEDPVYERTYPQLGQEARYFHASQGMGEDLPVEDYYVKLELAESVVDSEEEDSIFDGISYDFEEYAGQIKNTELNDKLLTFQEGLDEIKTLYPNRQNILKKNQKMLNFTKKIIEELNDDKYNLSDSTKEDLLNRLDVKEEQLQELSVEASELDVKLVPDNNEVVRGEKTKVSVVAKNNGKTKIPEIDVDLSALEGWDVSGQKRTDTINPGKSKSVTFDVEVDEESDYYHPFDEAVMEAEISYVLMDAEVKQTITLDSQDPLAVLPDFGIELSPENAVINLEESEQELDVDANVKNYVDGENKGRVKLDVPKGWRVKPKEIDVSFLKQDEEKEVSFKVYPDDQASAGEFELNSKVVNDKGEFSDVYHPFEYDHIGKSYWPKGDSSIKAKAFSLSFPDELNIGYVNGGFDKVPEALKRVGMNVTELTPDDIQSGDLDKYDTIALGIRSYLSREDLQESNDRLLQYVEDGGHVVAQYHTPLDNWDTNKTAPFKLKIGEPSIEWRVTDENSEINLLKPNSPLFNWPNKISDNDWGNWENERGLYFPMDWDEQFEPYLSMSDRNDFPWNGPFDGGILMAHYGDGTYMYTNLGWYRQIQNLVPGGYRIFTNLLGYPLHDVDAEYIELLIEEYNYEGEFDSDDEGRLLTTHMNVINHYEKTNKDEKVLKHMEGFKSLLEQQRKEKLISEKAYKHLKAESKKLIDKY